MFGRAPTLSLKSSSQERFEKRFGGKFGPKRAGMSPIPAGLSAALRALLVTAFSEMLMQD